jgi:hypothetical protein
MHRWRRAIYKKELVPKRSLSIRWKGTSWGIVFAREPILGRAEADIVVPAPLVSRRHLRFRVGAACTVEDLGSVHGSVIQGARLGGPVAVKEPLEIVLGGSIACLVRPVTLSLDGVPSLDPQSENGLVVDVASRKHFLAFGPVAALGPWLLVMEGSRIVLRARDGQFYLDDDNAPHTEAELGPGDEIRSIRDGDAELIIDADSFEKHVPTE